MERNVSEMKKVFKTVALISAAVLSLGVISGCGSSSASSKNGHVYYLSAKPEQQKQFKEIAASFTKKTGIPVDVSVAASGTGEQTLKSELAKANAPTLFDVDNNSFPFWTNYYADMSKLPVYTDLKNKSAAMKDNGKVAAVPFVMERLGIIYNKALLQKYFDASWSSVKSIDKLNNFKSLKTVADEIQSHKSDLGVKGAFSSAGFDSSSSGRYGDQLAHIPLYYDCHDKGITRMPSKVSHKYMKNMKNLFDLYITDSTVPASQLSGKTMDDSNSEFSLGEAVFIQNGTWAYPQLKGQKVADQDMGVLPVYIGVDGEEKAGLPVSYMYWSMNKNSSQKDKEATEKFLNYILKDDAARKVMTNEMSFETPFKSYAAAGFQTKNPIHRANDAYAKAGNYDVTFYPLPTQQWVQNLSSSMLEYAQGTGDWNKVESTYVDGWASEYKTIDRK